MQQAFETTRISRKTLSQYLDDYSLEQLNKIPQGFNNNLIWNIGHIIVVQQMLVYNLSGLPMLVSPEMVAKYKRGTRLEKDATQEEADEMRALLFTPIEQTEIDFSNKIFKDYTEYTAASGFRFRNVEDAIAFNCYHEGMHIGMMMGIRKFV